MSSAALAKNIKSVLEEIQPLLARHAGGLDFIKFEEGIVYVKLKGMCDGCPLSQVTLKAGVERMLKDKIKEVKKVEAV